MQSVRVPRYALAKNWTTLVVVLVTVVLITAVEPHKASAQLCVFLTGAAYKQNFNTLPSSGTSNNSSTLPQGFAFSEAGTGGTLTYTADNGGLSTGNTYSYGSTGSSERALGELTSGTVQSTIGACFLNDTGFVIPSLAIKYTGEMWRLGAADAIVDRLDFQFSTNATSIVDEQATWIDVNTLDFVSPNNTSPAGAKDGNATANRTTTAPIAIIPTGGIPDGAVFYIRWLSIANIGGTNDGLAIDDFQLTYRPSADFNQDTFVDGKDLLMLQRGFGMTSGAAITNGDANGDGAVDGLDMYIFRSQFGAFGDDPPPGAPPAGASVPEPFGAALIAVAGYVALARRRRHA
jgi:hypothetical protein